jgi:hypothetical protein
MNYTITKTMNKLVAPLFLLAIVVAIAVIFTLRREAMVNRTEGLDVSSKHQMILEEEQIRRASFRRDRSSSSEEGRQAARNLAMRMIEKKSLIPNRMLRQGEVGFPPDLIKKASLMKSSQLRLLVCTLVDNPELCGPHKVSLVTAVTSAWLKEQKDNSKQALNQVLDILAEVLPLLPQGQNNLPVTCAMGYAPEWDHQCVADFFETHWTLLGGPKGNCEYVRRELLKGLVDPQLRMRVEKLPMTATNH